MEALHALIVEDGILTLTGHPSRRVRYEFMSASNTGFGPADQIVDVTFVVQLVDAFWRATNEATSPAVTLGSALVSVTNLFPGLSAPVGDAVVRVRGQASGVQVTDAGGGSWFTFDSVPAGQWLRVQGRRAFLTSTDVWAGGTEVSGRLSFGGPRRRFELTPVRGASPSTRAAALTIATASRSGTAQIQVRGRSAHLQAEH